jgi:hypothetical protein
LDIIGKAVFNYDFNSLSNGTGIVEVSVFSWGSRCFAVHVSLCYELSPLVPLDLKLVFLWVGCVYSNAGSWSQKHRNFSLLEGSAVETHCTSATEGNSGTQTHKWDSGQPDCNMQGVTKDLYSESCIVHYGCPEVWLFRAWGSEF